MNLKIDTSAVAELIGSILLLFMAICFISVIYIQVFSNPGPSEETYVTLVGKMEPNGELANTISFENKRGETLGLETEIIWKIGGPLGVQNSTTIKILSFLYPFLQDGWNIGEKIHPISNQIDYTDVQIDATIIDKKSNSIVFWGRLQEGYIVPPFGRGGIWHFNESSWNGSTFEVKDSSGNGNHGTAYNGANTSDDIISPLANRSGIFNAVDYDDYIEIKDAYSLDITDHITIEAWIKPLSDSAGGTIGLLNQFGYTPYITNVLGDKYLFAVVSEDTHHEGNLQTINITPHHSLTENNIVDIEYDFGEGNPNQQSIRPIITHVKDSVYLVAYNTKSESKNLSVYLKTYNIFSNGSIECTGNKIFDDRESNIGEPNRPSIVKVYDGETYSIFAIAYGIYVDADHPSVGVIKTINISSDGKIKYTGKTANFDDVQGYRPSIIHVSGEVFAVAYRSASNIGVIKTFNISSDGSIEYTGKEFVFDDKTNNKELIPPSIIKVSDYRYYSVFAITYGTYIDNSHPGVGIIKTVNIFYSNGTIVNTGNNKTFESFSCYDPFIMHHSENYYIIVYSTGNPPHGNYTLIEIAKNGSIVIRLNNILVLPFQNNQRCENPIAIKISERGLGIVFGSIAGGSGHPGYLMPIYMQFPSDLYSKGIYKLGSYGIFANQNEVFVNINSKTINTSIVAYSWNYIVLTYDRNQMKLYVNGVLRKTTSFTESIRITNSNLIFGDLFYGLLDEVAIYDNVLSDKDVYNHFKQFAPIIISNVNSSNITYSSVKITWDTNRLGNSVVRYGTTIPPTNTASDFSWLTSHTIKLSNLLSKTTYYFEVESTSTDDYTIIDNNGGRYYTFNTENSPPNEPREPNPEDGEEKIKINAILRWIGGDEDGDDVFYDVYLWEENSPVKKVSENQSADFYDPIPDLKPITKYYWQIIAKDVQGASTAGLLWYFITKK